MTLHTVNQASMTDYRGDYSEKQKAKFDFQQDSTLERSCKVLSVISAVYPFPQAHERLEDVKLEAVRNNNVELVSEILSDISCLAVQNDSAAELSKILKEPHFQVNQLLVL